MSPELRAAIVAACARAEQAREVALAEANQQQGMVLAFRALLAWQPPAPAPEPPLPEAAP